MQVAKRAEQLVPSRSVNSESGADHMDEWAGVLGHEIGHVIHRHSVKLIEKQRGARLGLAVGRTRAGNDPKTAAGIESHGLPWIFQKFLAERWSAAQLGDARGLACGQLFAGAHEKLLDRRHGVRLEAHHAHGE